MSGASRDGALAGLGVVAAHFCDAPVGLARSVSNGNFALKTLVGTEVTADALREGLHDGIAQPFPPRFGELLGIGQALDGSCEVHGRRAQGAEARPAAGLVEPHHPHRGGRRHGGAAEGERCAVAL